jgi:hypothetical protein
MRDAGIFKILFARHEMINHPSENLGVTLSDEAKREAPVRTEPHPTRSLGEWFSSRRDSTIVARHEVPGIDPERQPRPGGTVEVVVSPEWREDKER